jgi:hypothetical protein
VNLYVTNTGFPRILVAPFYPAALATPASPRVTDAPQPVAAHISVRLLERYTAEAESVQHASKFLTNTPTEGARR